MSKTTTPRGTKAKKTSPKAAPEPGESLVFEVTEGPKLLQATSPKAASKPGKIVVTQATASSIRESLGVTSTEAKVGASALRSVLASAPKAAPKTVKPKKRTPARPTATR